MQDAPKTGLVEIKTWRDFTKVMCVLSGDAWLYRGQEDASWKLKSSLERDIEDRHPQVLTERERSNIELFRANAKLLGLCWESDISALIAMQHHGAKTRLLDFSTSMMVALFFAFEKAHKMPKRRAIYAVNFKALCESDYMLHLYTKYREKHNDLRKWEEWIRVGSGRSLLVEDVKFRKFIEETAEDVIASGNHANGILPLYTAATNRRQRAQAGVQLMPCTFDPFVDNLAAALGIDNVDEINNPSYCIVDIAHKKMKDVVMPTSVIKFVFEESLESDARNILNQANISYATIYPDIIGLSMSLDN